jgi:cysteinyl-tRNA synthetase
VRTKHVAFPYASDYIPAQIKMIQTLVDKGYGYRTPRGIYFDTSKFETYGKLGKVNLGGQRKGARVESDSDKRNPTDFILWKTSDKIGWESPWGQGFPGWHIECSAMIRELLGDQIDIHTGGVEHIGVHHQNEIAQSEAATGKHPFSRFWLHRAHLQFNNEKIAKSAGTAIYLEDIRHKGYSPLTFRYLLLGSHYRTPANFTWEALDAAQTAYRKLKNAFSDLPADGFFKRGKISPKYQKEFSAAIGSDLNTPEALALVWKLIKDESVPPRDKRATLLSFDKVLGLKLDANEFEVKEVPANVQKLLDERERARHAKDFHKSDQLRDEIRQKGFVVEDTDSGQKLSRA